MVTSVVAHFKLTFFYFEYCFLHFFTIFWCCTYIDATTKGWKQSIGFLDSEFYAESFEEKKFINKIKCSGSLPDPDFLGVTISSHVIHFRFLPIFRHLRTTQENQNRLIRSRRICCNWGENFRLSQKKIFLEPIRKSPYIVNYLWAGVSNYVYSIIFVITKIYIFPLLYFTPVLLLKRSQPSSTVSTGTSTAAFYHCWSYAKYSGLWIRFVVYVWFFLMRYANLFDFWFDKRQRQVYSMGSEPNWYQIRNRFYTKS